MMVRSFATLTALFLFSIVSIPAATTMFPVDELRPGMVGIGRTVFEGDRLDEFKVHGSRAGRWRTRVSLRE